MDYLHPPTDPLPDASRAPEIEGDGGSSVSSGKGSLVGSLEDLETRTAQFTQYSMTSSIIPRSEGWFLVLVIFPFSH